MGILELLAEKKIIKPGDIASINLEAEQAGTTVEQILLKRGIGSSEILQIKGEYLDIPTRRVDENKIPSKVLEYIPEQSASYYQFAPLDVKDGVLEVGVVDPDNIEARDALNFISSKAGLPFKIFLISEEDFARVMAMYKGLSSEVSKALSELETELTIKSGPTEDAGPEEEALSSGETGKKTETDTKITEDAPVTKIVSTIIRYATDGNASDIHIEPMRGNVRVRFRVDGVMNTSIVLPLKVHSAVVARIKIQSNMKLDEKRKPQDGRFTVKIGERKVDFRVSTFPTYFGEKVVMRILDQERGIVKLADMGLTDRNLKLVQGALKAPYGIILISGPTGSGKTTTLYSMLKELDLEGHNVLSLEDPIEYNIDGMSQSQVRPDIGYTFANGLRTTLRQDPDIIMVGEIRDKETAQLAIQAALTGHLVLSTIHTNNAIGVIPRLIDMGVDQYLIAPTLVLAMAQRLVRKLCPNSGKPLPIEGSIKTLIDKQFADLPEEHRLKIEIPKEVYEIAPSTDCPNGTRGRTAVMEVLSMSKELESVILNNPTEIEIAKLARAGGMLSMKEDAILKSFNRVIPFEEIATL